MRNVKGFTLIEIMVTLVILAIGITSVMAVMTTARKQAFAPDLQWVAVKIADVILADFMAKTLQQFPCAEQTKSNDDLCYFQNIQQANFNYFFDIPENDFKQFKMSVKLKAIPGNNVLISLVVSHPELGPVQFDAIKAINHA